jgi:hypothetical protein
LLEHSFVSDVSSRCSCDVGVVNAPIKGEIEDHVSFEDWWMIASSCDE